MWSLPVIRRALFAASYCLVPVTQTMAEKDMYVIDDRSSGDLSGSAGSDWRLVTDGVMGGVSEGRLTPANVKGRDCLRLQGEVRLDNNGGFIQAALAVPGSLQAVAVDYKGVSLEVYGNGEEYNLHLRTGDLWLPWQSYRSTFTAIPEWQTLYLPFDGFEPYRTWRRLDTSRIKRLGIVAIGRKFNADLCIGQIGFYRQSG